MLLTENQAELVELVGNVGVWVTERVKFQRFIIPDFVTPKPQIFYISKGLDNIGMNHVVVIFGWLKIFTEDNNVPFRLKVSHRLNNRPLK